MERDCPDCDRRLTTRVEETHQFVYGVGPGAIVLSATYPEWICECGTRIQDWEGEQARDAAVVEHKRRNGVNV